MPTYELRAESPVDSQARITTVDAPNEAAARAHIEAQELAIVNFSLLPPEKAIWEDPHLHGSDDGHVDLSLWDAYDPAFGRQTALHTSHAEAVRAGNQRIADWGRRVELKDGKVVDTTLGKRSKARLLAHRQSEPYAVVDVRAVPQTEIDTQRLVRQVAAAKQDPDQWLRMLDALREAGVPMAAVTAALHGIALKTQDDGSAPQVWSSDTIAIPLLTAYTPNVDTDQFWSAISSTEITGTGYSANGPTLGTKTSAYDTATDQTRESGANVSLTTTTLSTTALAIVDRTPSTDATREVIGHVLFGTTVTTTAGTLGVTWDATGIVNRDYT